jgi:hypothetical protein
MSSLIRALLGGVIDYAGLFPPAKLSMAETVQNFSRYRISSESWMLGRLIVPIARIEEFEEAASHYECYWPLSVIGEGSLSEDLADIASFNERRSEDHDMQIVSLEKRLTGQEELAAHDLATLNGLEVYFEIPATSEDDVARLAARGLMAKIRTGGLVPEAFPSTAQLATFLTNCHESQLASKATAGLHHPLRAPRKATAEATAPIVEMHGFLNLFIASAMLHAHAIDSSQLADILNEQDIAAFEFSNEQVRWRDAAIDVEQIEAARRNRVRSFGSCSFDEPVEDLKQLNLLPH